MAAPQEFVRTVLIIDDTIDHLILNKAILESENYEVFTASSGRTALNVLVEISPPDLILLDLQMAEMSGLEFIIELEKIRPDILQNVPIVFLTGMNEVPKSKATGFIKKPIDIENLLASVRGFIERGMPHRNLAVT